MDNAEKLLPELSFQPLTADRWADFEVFFGREGAHEGCWCMWWRMTKERFEEECGAGNRQAMKEIVLSGKVPGILAYTGDQPVAWCSIGPRADFPALGRYYPLEQEEDRITWSIVCFFVAQPYRRQGMMTALIGQATLYAVAHGAAIVEGYPIQPKEELTGFKGYTGIDSSYLAAGFSEVYRDHKGQLVMRYYSE